MLEYLIPQIQRSWVIQTETGKLRISKAALIDLIYCSTADIRGYKKIKAKAEISGLGVKIMVDCQAEPQYETNELAERIQKRITESIEHHVQIEIKEVRVLVRHLRTAFRK